MKAVCVFLATLILATTAENPCKTSEICKCEKEDGTVIDLRALSNQEFNAISSQTEWDYRVNLCQSLSSAPKDCGDSNLCQINNSASEAYSLGTADSFEFTMNGENLAVQYQDGNRTSIVTLICPPTATGAPGILIFKSENPPQTYNFELDSDHACAVSNTTSPTLATNATTTPTPAANITTPAPNTTATTTPEANTTATTTPAANTTETSPAANTTETTTPMSNTTTPMVTNSTTPAGNSTMTTTPLPVTNSTMPSNSTATPSKPTDTTPKTDTTTQGAGAISSFTVGALLAIAYFSRRIL